MKRLYLLHDRRYTTTHKSKKKKKGEGENKEKAYTIDSYIKGVGTKGIIS
jgi:hypothetical protein